MRRRQQHYGNREGGWKTAAPTICLFFKVIQLLLSPPVSLSESSTAVLLLSSYTQICSLPNLKQRWEEEEVAYLEEKMNEWQQQ